jgi:plastocyanin domain-containing protein
LSWTTKMRENVAASSTFITTEGDMRSLIKLSAVLVICFIGIGFYQGWFSLSSPNSESESNKANINVSVDKGKMRSDIKTAGGKVRERIKERQDKRQAKETK